MNEINRKFRKSRGFGFVETLNGYVFTPEANAHTFRIQCVVQEDNLETVVPFETGSVVSARFLKSDHVTELVEGSLDENGAAVVTLPAECYAVPGRFLLTILVAYNSMSVCVYAATGTVIGAESGTVNLSQNASREIDEKIAELNAAAAQVNSAISAGSAKITEINQAAAAARASIPQDYTALSDSVGDLKSAFNKSTSIKNRKLVFEKGLFNGTTGESVANGDGTRWRSTGFIRASDISMVRINQSDVYQMLLYAWNDSGYVGYFTQNYSFTTNSSSMWVSSGINFVKLGSMYPDYKYRIVLRGINTSLVITESEAVDAVDVVMFASDDYTKNVSASMYTEDIIGSAIDYNTGALVSNTAYSATEYIDVSGIGTLYMSSVLVRGAFYDDSKTFICGISNNGTDTQNVIEIVIPANAKYMRLSTYVLNPLIVSADMDVYKIQSSSKISGKIQKSSVLGEERSVLLDMRGNIEHTLSSCTGVSVGPSRHDGYFGLYNGGSITYDNFVCMDSSIMSVTFKTLQSTIVKFGYNPKSEGKSITSGYYIAVDFSQKTVSHYRWSFKESDQPALIGTESATWLNQNTDITIQIEKKTAKWHTAKIYQAANIENSIDFDVKENTSTENPNLDSGMTSACWGGIYIETNLSIHVRSLYFASTGNVYPKLAIWGDSYVEGRSRNYLCSYARRLKEKMGNEVWLSGGAGATTSDIILRLSTELKVVSPQYAIINAGVNDIISSNNSSTIISNLNTIINLLLSKNITPVLITIPPLGDAYQTSISEVNSWVKNSGFKYIDLAYVMSIGDSSTQNTLYFMPDNIHPNILGGLASYMWILNNLCEIT